LEETFPVTTTDENGRMDERDGAASMWASVCWFVLKMTAIFDPEGSRNRSAFSTDSGLSPLTPKKTGHGEAGVMQTLWFS